MTSTTVQFLVEMTCDSCVESVKKVLENVDGVKIVDIDLAKSSVVVESSLPILDVQEKLETTGRPVAIKGYDGSMAAVSILEAGDEKIQGVIRFIQVNPNTCIIDGTIDGLNPGNHNIAIHECGDLSTGCASVGKMFVCDSRNKDYGDLGKIVAEKNGRATFRKENNIVKLADVIGRSLVVSSKLNGLPPILLSCGIIARSAGLFQNPKTICACDGTTIWDEASKPNSKSSL
ncbi:unnamed protein product [Ceutorhynchus assimilis]|uniref:superoxide dismutase n=1 Tax=Ceutorhynchus assimilis TaxID=467358 RepID=A0A9P0GJY3_9CUCU|nr:unnamed protein product [Ceutorhynchus assimilis]